MSDYSFIFDPRDASRGHLITREKCEILHHAALPTALWVHFRGRTFRLEPAERKTRAKPATSPGREEHATLNAPMPGVVLIAKAKNGNAVKQGDLLFVLEAMKMEHEIRAPTDGTITRVLAKAGQRVERGAALVEISL